MKTFIGLLLISFVFLALIGHAADERQELDQRLEVLQKEWEKTSDAYKAALIEKRGLIEKEIEEGEKLVKKEQDKDLRKTLLKAVKDLRAERAGVNDKIRIINAGDVVRFSNGRNKVLATLTGQTPA
jgi:hypothetical protein